MHYDKRGLPVTAACQSAVDVFDAGVDEFLASGRDAARLLKRIAEVDPEMVMGQVLRGYFMRLPALAHLTAKSGDALAAAKRLKGDATERERRHVDALAAWCGGDLRRTKAAWERILIDHPHDILALRLAHYMHFFLGDLDEMRDSMARLMPRWTEDVPGCGFVLGCRAFSLEESHELAAAEPLGRRAVEINENDIWAGHAVAHVLEAEGRRREGIGWIDDHEAAWQKRGLFAHHMWWHRALHYLEFERFDEVLAAYDREFWAEPSEDNTDLCNSSSMLMRLAMLGLDVGERWQPVAAICAGRIGERLRPFNDLHYVMALAMAGRLSEAKAMLASMRAFADAHPGEDVTLAKVYRESANPVAEAVIAFAERNYGRVVEIMSPARYRMVPLGGSWAQRDVWVRMLIHAAIADGQDTLARALLAERTAGNPGSAPTWSLYADALDRCGADGEHARARAAALRAAH